MFKDYNKYLTTSLKVYLFVLIIIFIMKIVGLDYFGLTTDNANLIKISEFLVNTHLADLINFIIVFIQFHLYLCIVCKKKKLFAYSIIGASLNIILQIILTYFSKMNALYYLMSFLIMIIIPIMIIKKLSFKRQLKYIIILTLYQIISLYIRNINVNYQYSNFIIDTILNFDQILMLVINYKIFFTKGDVKLCGQELEVGLSSLKKINLKKSLTKLQKNWLNFKKQDKVSKLTFIIYFILSLIWNTLSVLLILLVARLNDTFIECIFILTSFWLSKKSFGKAFHLKSMGQCFIVSNLTYYTLNRITTPIGISIIIPIMLGVGLSYVTSKLVKKKYKPLYKGMPEELFEETILKVTDKNSIKYKICYDFYIKNKSVVSLALKYNYSEVGIRKIKDRINDKIKGLE